MNDDDRLERLFSDGLHSVAPTRAPGRLRTNITREVAQASPRPRWLAFIKEPPMRTNSRLAVGSPTWRAATVMAATLLVAALVIGASFAGAQLLAKDGFIVDASGGGTHTSIAAAVAEAEDGYDIFVRPGTYVEAFELDKTVSIVGDGPVEEIVVTAPEGGSTVPLTVSSEADPYAIHVTGGEPTVTGLTFRGQPSEIIITGGAPTLDGLVMEDVGWAFDGTLLWGGSSIVAISDDASVTVRDSVLLRGGPIALFGAASAVIEGNRLVDGPHLFLPDHGPDLSVVGNEVTGTNRYGLNIHDSSGAVIEGNTFTNNRNTAIRIRDGGDGLVVGNTVVGGDGGGIVGTYGLVVEDADGLQLTENTVTNVTRGITWRGGSGSIEGNKTSENEWGLWISRGTPTVDGNTSCDNSASNFTVGDPATPEVGENDFCPEPDATS